MPFSQKTAPVLSRWLTLPLVVLFLFVGTLGLSACAMQDVFESLTNTDSSHETGVLNSENSPTEVPVLTDETYVEPIPDPVTVDVIMIGDILLHDHINNCAWTGNSYNYDFLFEHIKDEVAAADIAILNQETPLGGADRGYATVEVPIDNPTEKQKEHGGAKVPVMPIFNSPEEVGHAEVAAGFNVILNAHNHVFDQGYGGLSHELNFWENNYPDVAVLGVKDPAGEAGNDYAHGVYIYEKDGFKIAILNYTYGTNLSGGDSDWWVLSYLNEDKIYADCKEARELGADFIIACPHWGLEYINEPSDDERYFAQVLADAGVGLILGTHPHCIQPCTVLTGASGNSCVCFYSNGNFITANAGNINMVCGLDRVRLVKESDGTAHVVHAEFIPAVVHGGQGHDMTCYLLPDWTSELAQTSYNSSLTPEWVTNYCSQVLGSGFDPETGIYTFDLA